MTSRRDFIELAGGVLVGAVVAPGWAEVDRRLERADKALQALRA